MINSISYSFSNNFLYVLSIPKDVMIKYEGMAAAAATNIIDVVTRFINPFLPGNLCFDNG